jgi:capsular exopolysaccharide synthesis family protein
MAPAARTVAPPPPAGPSVPQEAVREERRPSRPAPDVAPTGPRLPAVDAWGPDDARLRRSHAATEHTVAESFRVLQANLIRALLEAKIRRVLVTSAGRGEGRSTVVANLGIALSQSAQRVLVIDADVRRAEQHRRFELSRSPGLVEYLLGEGSLSDVVRRTSTRSLSLVSGGRPVTAPAEPLSSGRMKELLEYAATQFDVVLLDAPAVLDVADTRVLAPLVDGVLVVARVGTVTQEALRQVRQSLQHVHARVLGLVLNRIPDAGARTRG